MYVSCPRRFSEVEHPAFRVESSHINLSLFSLLFTQLPILPPALDPSPTMFSRTAPETLTASPHDGQPDLRVLASCSAAYI